MNQYWLRRIADVGEAALPGHGRILPGLQSAAVDTVLVTSAAGMVGGFVAYAAEVESIDTPWLGVQGQPVEHPQPGGSARP